MYIHTYMDTLCDPSSQLALVTCHHRETPARGSRGPACSRKRRRRRRRRRKDKEEGRVGCSSSWFGCVLLACALLLAHKRGAAALNPKAKPGGFFRRRRRNAHFCTLVQRSFLDTGRHDRPIQEHRTHMALTLRGKAEGLGGCCAWTL